LIQGRERDDGISKSVCNLAGATTTDVEISRTKVYHLARWCKCNVFTFNYSSPSKLLIIWALPSPQTVDCAKVARTIWSRSRPRVLFLLAALFFTNPSTTTTNKNSYYTSWFILPANVAATANCCRPLPQGCPISADGPDHYKVWLNFFSSSTGVHKYSKPKSCFMLT
jgi:hypothetical protein